MKTVFADTGYWAALVNPRDQLHELAKLVSQRVSRARVITTEMVLDEVLAAFSRPPTRGVAINLVKAILTNPNVEVVPQTALQFCEAFRLYIERVDKAWSLTDCASFLLMTQRGIQDSLAHDEHFAQAGFNALLRLH
jgi:predicted nucleic acid-binding protein